LKKITRPDQPESADALLAPRSPQIGEDGGHITDAPLLGGGTIESRGRRDRQTADPQTCDKEASPMKDASPMRLYCVLRGKFRGSGCFASLGCLR